MSNIFLVSDTHFGHANILKFIREDGSRVRTFDSVEQMDECMIERWNSVVRPQDKVYHLGDVAMSRTDIWKVGQCNGHKRLVRGNHDDHDMKWYTPYFENIYGSRKLAGLMLTHIPIHPDSIGKSLANVHGHVHNNLSALKLGPQYYNVSVEVIDYTPVPIEEVLKNVKLRQEIYHRTGRCIQ
jgi:calcineurin-like phosphoesterase family protein